MKKIFNYRNTRDINCIVGESPLGFKLEEYPEINEKRELLRLDKLDLPTKVFVTTSYTDTTKYHVNSLFKEKKLKFTVNGSNKIKHPFLNRQHYLDVESLSVGATRAFTGEGYTMYHNHNALNEKGKRYLYPVEMRVLNFDIEVSNITSMEFVSKWWKKHIYINFNLKHPLRTGKSSFKLYFSKDDKEDAKFIVQEVDSMRRMIQTQEHEKVLERWEDDFNDELYE